MYLTSDHEEGALPRLPVPAPQCVHFLLNPQFEEKILVQPCQFPACHDQLPTHRNKELLCPKKSIFKELPSLISSSVLKEFPRRCHPLLTPGSSLFHILGSGVSLCHLTFLEILNSVIVYPLQLQLLPTITSLMSPSALVSTRPWKASPLATCLIPGPASSLLQESPGLFNASCAAFTADTWVTEICYPLPSLAAESLWKTSFWILQAEIYAGTLAMTG